MEALGSYRTIEITRMAMSGLIDRQQAISANTANVLTPNYQRKEVAFEDQLRDMIQKEDTKEQIKSANSAALSYKATTLDELKQPNIQQMALLTKNNFDSYKPEVLTDMASSNPETGNNVNVEKEMMDMAKAGTQFGILANLENKMFGGLAEVIRERS